jgi:hypothetical protein
MGGNGLRSKSVSDMTIRECILFGLEECAGALATHNKMMYSKTANETNGAKKYLEDNLHQLRRQLMTIFYNKIRHTVPTKIRKCCLIYVNV